MEKNILKNYLNIFMSSAENRKFLSFHFKSKNYFLVSLTVASEDKNFLNYEEICKALCPKYVSRRSVLDILSEGTKQEFFSKMKSTKNNRSSTYKIKSEPKKEIIDYLARISEISILKDKNNQ